MSLSSVVLRIGHYHYLRDDILGEGSTGKVYLGVNERTSAKVALKLIDMNEINNEVTKYLLECQKEALRCINSPHVVRLEDIYQQNNLCYIITDYCSGGNLKSYIRKKQYLVEAEAMVIFYKLLTGYKTIKDNHFIHRDLKSSNIMLKDKEPVIIDFGYCERTFGTKPKVFYNVGSPSYMSPQAYYKTIYSEKSDIWALGIILYQMLTGHTIDQDEQIHRYFSKIIKNGFSLPSRVSDECQKIIRSCLNISAQDRPKTNKLMKEMEQYFETKNQQKRKQENIHPPSLIFNQKNDSPIEPKLLRKSRQNLLLTQRIQTYPQPNWHQTNIKTHYIPHQNHFLAQSTNLKRYPHPLTNAQVQHPQNNQKYQQITDSIILDKNKILALSHAPRIVGDSTTTEISKDLWQKGKVSESLIFQDQQNPQQIKKPTSQIINLKHKNIQPQLLSYKTISYESSEPTMMRSFSQARNLAPNDSIQNDVMLQPQNAFMKKANPAIYEVKYPTNVKNGPKNINFQFNVKAMTPTHPPFYQRKF